MLAGSLRTGRIEIEVAFAVGLALTSGSVLGAGFEAPATPVPASGAGGHANILLILTDNQPASVLATYGNPDVATPNLDRLAAEGVRFDQAFAVHGLCSPTRATLHTGLLPSQHGVHDYLEDQMLESWPDDWSAIREFRTVPGMLRTRGYQTALVGKWHLGQIEAASELYDEWITLAGGHTTTFWDNEVSDNGRRYRVTDEHIVDHFTRRAVDYLATRDDEQPFFLMVSYDGPYLNPPSNTGPGRNRFYPRYENRELPSFPVTRIHESILRQLLRPDPGLDYKGQIEFGIHQFFGMLRMNADGATRANIASQNTLVDDGVGRLLAALDEHGLASNTVVLYTSDQGNFYGQHGLWGHTSTTFPSSMYDTPMRVPLVVRMPSRAAAGSVSDLMIGQYDIAPTLLELAGHGDAQLEGTPGRSFAAALEGRPLPDWPEEVYFDQAETRVVHTRRHAYWKRIPDMGAPALYDLEVDPEQRHNLYGDPAHAEVVRVLDAKLSAFFGRWAESRWDLWKGGTAKGSLARAPLFAALNGDGWSLSSDVVPRSDGSSR